jgi:putative Mg2+ transporter-C (MgtC) family protein
MIENLNDFPFLLGRILLAALLGGLIGLERHIHGRAAGLRTHLLVSAGASLFTIISKYIATTDIFIIANSTKVSDPGRIAAQIITGIGFLGAGVIIREGFTIKGLTTAACLWMAAAIGMAAGSGFYWIAIGTAIFALLSLIIFNYIENIFPKDSYRTLTITTTNEIDQTQLIKRIQSKTVKILFFDFERNYETGITRARMSLRFTHKGITDKLSHKIIQSVEEMNIPLKSIRWSHH